MSPTVILVIVGIIMLTVFGAVSYFSNRFSMNGIKSRTTGDGQHGTARWATEKEIRKAYRSVPYQPDRWRANGGNKLPQGIVVGCRSRGTHTEALVEDGDVHALMIGAAGVGKTAYFLYPNLEYACASGMSFLCTDTKGDLYRHYGRIAKENYGYSVSVLDLRNPTRSDGNNFLHLVNRYMDLWKEHPKNLAYRAKAEKYSKIISKTLILSGCEANSFGQNAFFYDAAEGLLTSVILLVAEFCAPEERHILSVFRILQEMLSPEEHASGKGKTRKRKGFQSLLEKLPETHKAKWFAGAALYTGDNAMNSVMSTALSRLNAFLDSELEQILCFDTAIDAEKFCNEKSAVFIVLPEEDNTKYFMVSMLVQQLYREILSVADSCGGKLPNRVMFFLDEFGTIPKIESAEMMFSASRSRRISIVAIIQSFAQLEKNYGKEGSEIIIDNTQLTVFGGFAPNAQAAEKLSASLGKRTVVSGSVSTGKNGNSQSLQMTGRELLSPDELRVLPKGTFVVTRTGIHPMMGKLKLFLDWGITFPREDYVVPERASRQIASSGRKSLEKRIEECYEKGSSERSPEDENGTESAFGKARSDRKPQRILAKQGEKRKRDRDGNSRIVWGAKMRRKKDEK